VVSWRNVRRRDGVLMRMARRPGFWRDLLRAARGQLTEM